MSLQSALSCSVLKGYYVSALSLGFALTVALIFIPIIQQQVVCFMGALHQLQASSTVSNKCPSSNCPGVTGAMGYGPY